MNVEGKIGLGRTKKRWLETVEIVKTEKLRASGVCVCVGVGVGDV